MNINATVNTSCPTHFNSNFNLNLIKNLGIDFEYIFSNKNLLKFNKFQREAWHLAQDAINQGYPCIAWGLKADEFYLVTGFDNDGYFYSGPLTPKIAGPLDWKKLGHNTRDILFLGIIKPCQRANDKEIISEALEFAYYFSTTRRWLDDGYESGLDAYDLWISALENGKIDGSGNAYNAAVWNQCRAEAVNFLKEAHERLPGVAEKEFQALIKCYQTIAYNLGQIAIEFPFLNSTPIEHNKQVKSKEKVEKAITCLENAKIAECQALDIIKDLIVKLNQ